MMNAVWTYKHTMGLFRYGRFMQIFTGVFNIVFSVVLGARFGLFGILAATVVSRMLTNLWYDPVVVYIHGFNKQPITYLKKYIKYIFILSVAATGCVIMTNISFESQFVKTVYDIAVCSIVTNIIFIGAFYRTNEFKMLINYIKRILNKILIKRNTI